MNLEKPTKTTLIEKIMLFFIKKQYFLDEFELTTLVYKSLKCKIYIINHFYNPPMHPMCRCTLISKKL